MSKKQFSMKAYWDAIAARHTPKLAFQEGQNFSEWKERGLNKLRSLLGDLPSLVPLDPDVEWTKTSEDGEIIRERVVFDTDEFMSVPCIIVRPVSMKQDKSNPAIICSHGHGPYGKEPVAGMRDNEVIINQIKETNYNFAEQMARKGYLTLALDLRGFGERRDKENPFPGRDPCNVNYVKSSILGIYTLSLNIWDISRCIDYLETRPEVDKNRIGMMGISQGGTMTTFTTALEPRIKAADIMGYVNPFAGFGIERANFCGSQVLPEVYKYFDTHDIAGLIAPRPLLLEMGEKDDCFFIEDYRKSFAELEKIYAAAGASDMLHDEFHPGGHEFAGNKAFDFFDKYL